MQDWKTFSIKKKMCVFYPDVFETQPAIAIEKETDWIHTHRTYYNYGLGALVRIGFVRLIFWATILFDLNISGVWKWTCPIWKIVFFL